MKYKLFGICFLLFFSLFKPVTSHEMVMVCEDLGLIALYSSHNSWSERQTTSFKFDKSGILGKTQVLSRLGLGDWKPWCSAGFLPKPPYELTINKKNKKSVCLSGGTYKTTIDLIDLTFIYNEKDIYGEFTDGNSRKVNCTIR